MNDNEVAGHPRRWTILVALCAALMVIVVDNTVLNVAVPAIAADFDATTGQLQAVIDAYVVVFAGLLIVAGVASDRYGRRRAVLVGLSVLGLASVAAAAAPSIWALIAARGAMGVGAALVMPATLAVIVQIFPGSERPKAFAAWAAVAAAAMALGPVIGGALVQAWGWAGVFLMNVPVAGIGVAGIAWLVPESRDPSRRGLDLPGAVLVTIGMVALITTVILIPEHGFTDPVVMAGAAAAVALTGFIVRQRRAASPMVDLCLYRDSQFAGASLAAALLTLGTGSALFVLLQYLQLVLGHDPITAGLAIIPLATGVVLGSTAGGHAPSRIGYRHSIAAGFVLTALGFGVLATLDPSSTYGVVAIGLALAGGGTGFASPATTSVVLGAVPAQRAGMGTALNDTHQQLGIAFGVATLGSVLATVYRAALPDGMPDQATTSLAATLAYANGRADRTALVDAAHTAFTNAQTVTMLLASACATLGAVLGWTVLNRDNPRHAGKSELQSHWQTVSNDRVASNITRCPRGRHETAARPG